MTKWIWAAAIALTGCFQVTAELGHDDAGKVDGGAAGGGTGGGGAGGGIAGGAGAGGAAGGGGMGGGAGGGTAGGGGAGGGAVDAGCKSVDFILGSAPSMGSNPVAVVLTDVNGDLRPDLVVATLGGQLMVALSTGPGTFAVPHADALSSLGFSALAAADFNGDGKLDIALGDFGGNVTILVNTAGVFTKVSSTPTNGTLFHLAAGELNADTRADFVAGINAGTGPGVVVGFGNPDSGAPLSSTQPVDPPGNLEVADVDGDGNPDIVASSSGSGADVAVLRGNGDGTFKTVQHSSAGFTVFKVHVGDFDRDGKLDAVVTGHQPQGAVLMHGNGDGTFAAAQSLPGLVFGTVISPDLNGDGKLDLVAAFGTGFSVLLGDGDGGLKNLGTFGGVGEARDVAAADLDSDGVLDLAVVDYSNGKVQVVLTHCKP